MIFNRSIFFVGMLVFISTLIVACGGTAANSMGFERYHHTVTLMPDGNVLVVGGLDSKGIGIGNGEIYDPKEFKKNESMENSEAERLAKEEAEKLAKDALIELGLENAMKRKIRTYSRGMRQKTKVARATIFDPDILVLDEPFQGADPTTRHLLMEKMIGWAKKGKTILISSHILHDVEDLTDKIILINNF